MQIQKLSSSKLFYKKWLYKIECEVIGANSISHRGVEKTKAMCLLKRNKERFHWRLPTLSKIQKADLLAFIYAVEPFLKLKDQLKVRVEYCTYSIYCNDLVLLENIHTALASWVKSVVGPTTKEESDFMLDNGYKKILRDKLPHGGYQYKVHFKKTSKLEERILWLTWFDQFPENFSINSSTHYWLSNPCYIADPCIYVKDSKTLTMLGLKTGGNISRVDEFILREKLVPA